MLPAGTTWVVPPSVAEKARMTDSGILGCPYRFLESDEPLVHRWKPGVWLATPSPALPRISGSPGVGAIIGPRTVILGGGNG